MIEVAQNKGASTLSFINIKKFRLVTKMIFVFFVL